MVDGAYIRAFSRANLRCASCVFASLLALTVFLLADLVLLLTKAADRTPADQRCPSVAGTDIEGRALGLSAKWHRTYSDSDWAIKKVCPSSHDARIFWRGALLGYTARRGKDKRAELAVQASQEEYLYSIVDCHGTTRFVVYGLDAAGGLPSDFPILLPISQPAWTVRSSQQDGGLLVAILTQSRDMGIEQYLLSSASQEPVVYGELRPDALSISVVNAFSALADPLLNLAALARISFAGGKKLGGGLPSGMGSNSFMTPGQSSDSDSCNQFFDYTLALLGLLFLIAFLTLIWFCMARRRWRQASVWGGYAQHVGVEDDEQADDIPLPLGRPEQSGPERPEPAAMDTLRAPT
eukprot:g60528.t1